MKNLSLKKTFSRLFEQKEDEKPDETTDDTTADDADAGDTDAGDEDFGGSGDGGFDFGGGGGGGGSSSSSDDDEASKDKKTDEEEDEKIEVSAEDKARLADSIDSELETFFVNAETDARKSAVTNAQTNENKRYSVMRVLFESTAASDIDLKAYAAEAARLIKNYDNLLDMESIILNKAFSHIKNNYGDETVKALKDVLEQDYKLDVHRKSGDEKDVPEAPIAVGSMPAVGGGV